MPYKKLSIIIPCLNEAEQIVATLNKLQGIRQQGHEVIISDGGSTDKTIALSENLADNCINSLPGRARQMNEGAKVATGDILCFLHADTTVPNYIDQKILNTFNKKKHIWGFFNIRLSGPNWQFRIIEWLINIRSCLSSIATGDQGIFVDKNTFNKLSGYSEIPLMEDIELSKRLRAITKPACIKDTPLLTSSRRWEKHGIIRTVLLMWTLRWRYFSGTPATQLIKSYQPHNTHQSQTRPYNNRKTKQKQLIIFVKSPVPGKCKTRLTPYLSAEQACEFYKKLINTCFANISLLNKIDIAIYAYPDTQNPYIKNLAQTHSTSLHIQQGHNLGDRMHNAIKASLQTYDKSVLIGTDCPVLNHTYINQAFEALEQHDMVLGPAKDGGYVLIGATKIDAGLFSGIHWGTDTVLQQSIENNKVAGYTTHLLNTLWDIDVPEDYIQYQSQIKARGNDNG